MLLCWKRIVLYSENKIKEVTQFWLFEFAFFFLFFPLWNINGLNLNEKGEFRLILFCLNRKLTGIHYLSLSIQMFGGQWLGPRFFIEARQLRFKEIFIPKYQNLIKFAYSKSENWLKSAASISSLNTALKDHFFFY